MAVMAPAGSTWWERRDKTGGLVSLSLSLSAEEIDQIGRLCLCKTQTFARPGPGCITQSSNTASHNWGDFSTDITPACKFICSSPPLWVVKILENLQLKHCQPREMLQCSGGGAAAL